MFQDGQTFGDFEILGGLGQGGAGATYKARQVSADRIVALKTMSGVPVTVPEVVARFCREAKVAVSLDHPDLVRAYAMGETGGVHWLAMEFVEGTNAQARLKRKGRLALPEAVAIATHVAGALAHGWRMAGIVHGDVEPDTILLSKKSEVKLAGLGFGHALGEMKAFVAEGAPTGAAHYVSPERAEGNKDADLRADIYSLGCTLFHLISGEPPYLGDTALAVVLHHITKPVPELRTARPECPAAVSRTVAKMMHKLPAGRHQNYDELIADLRLCYEAITAAPTVAAAPIPAPVPAPALVAAPRRESFTVPLAKAVAEPKAEPTIKLVAKPEPKAEAPQRAPAKEPKSDFSESDESENAPLTGSRRSLKMPLAIGGGALLSAIVALAFLGPWKKQKPLSEAERTYLERAARNPSGKPENSATPKPGSTAGSPIRPITAPKPAKKTTPAPAKIASTEPEPAAPPPAPASMPAPEPATQPATPAAGSTATGMLPPPEQSATAKWIAEQEPKWQAAFAAEVAGPFEKGVASLKAQHLVAVERELATPPRAGESSAGEAFRAERARVLRGGAMPAEDESMAPASLKEMRTNYRVAFAKLDKDRFAKAKTVHARFDAILAQSQAALSQRQRTGEAQEIQALRASLRDAWLTPPASTAAVVADMPAAPPEPVPAVAAPGPKLAKFAPRELAERLLALGATFSIDRGGALSQVETMADISGDKFTVAKIEFLPREGASPADLDIIEQLTAAEEVIFTAVPATDATLKLLRNLPALRVLTLRDLKGVTAAGFRFVATLPALKTLNVRGPVGAESLSAFATNRKLDSLALDDVTFAEHDFAAIAGIPVLKTLKIATRDPVVPAAWARLAGAKKLATLTVEKTPKSAEMIAQLARISTLTSISLGDVTLPDSDLAPLATLKLLKTLKTTPESTLDGNVFAAWPPHTAMKSLTLGSTRSVSDKALRGIAAAFPALDHLEVRADAGSVTSAGLAHLQKLRHLNYLTFTGDAVDSAALTHLLSFDQIRHLGLGAARLTEADVGSLGKFSSLRELEWFNPPVSDAALKGYAKLRALTQFKIGGKAKPEVADKLSTVLPTVKVIP